MFQNLQCAFHLTQKTQVDGSDDGESEPLHAILLLGQLLHEPLLSSPRPAKTR
jgi:hypothetical protein